MGRSEWPRVRGKRMAAALDLFGELALRPGDKIAGSQMNIYLGLTREFNAGALRAILSSGQAVVLHRLAIMSKDGDWILREDGGALDHVLARVYRPRPT